jgi:hypothetical protein
MYLVSFGVGAADPFTHRPSSCSGEHWLMSTRRVCARAIRRPLPADIVEKVGQHFSVEILYHD